MTLSDGSDKAFFLSGFVWWLGPLDNAFICGKDLASVAAIFSVQAQIHSFLPGCSGVISDVLTP